MKPVLGAVCLLALIPVATPASEIPTGEDARTASCLQRAAAARSADYAHQSRLNSLATERMGAMGNTSFGSGAASRPVGSRIPPGLVAVSKCNAVEEKKKATAPHTGDFRRFLATRGGVRWKAR